MVAFQIAALGFGVKSGGAFGADGGVESLLLLLLLLCDRIIRYLYFSIVFFAFLLQELKRSNMGVQKVQFCCDDEAGRRGLMCNKSPTSSVQSNCMLPPYHCRQLTVYTLGPLVVSGKPKLL